MANKIQIKRSVANGTVTGLSNGELAFTQASNTLYIGLPDGSGVLRIAGEMVPGTLTANQALVANSTFGIDKVIVANLVPTTIWANGSAGTDGQLLTTNGSIAYWSTPAPSVVGSDTQVQFNDGGALGADAGLTFNKTTDLLTTGKLAVANTTSSTNTTTGAATVAGGLGVQGRINVTDMAIGNDSVYATVNNTVIGTNNLFATGTVNGSVISVGGWVIANQSGVFASGGVNASVIGVGTQFSVNTTQISISQGMKLSANGSLGSANQVLRTDASGTAYWSDDLGDISGVTAGDGLTGGGTSGDITLNVGAGDGITVAADTVGVLANNGIIANSTGVFAKSANGISVDSSGINVTAGANGGLVSNSSGVWVAAGNGLFTDSTGLNIGAGNGISVSADAFRVQQANGIIVDAGGVHIDAANGLVANTTGLHVGTGNGVAVDADSVRVVAGTGVTVNASGVHIGQAVETTSNVTFSNVVTSNLSVTGTVSSNVIPVANLTYHLGNNTNRWAQVHGGNGHFVTGTFDGNVNIGGDLIVTGNVTTVNVNSVVVSDPMIYLAGNNYSSDLVDIGFAANYNDGTNRHTGFFRDHTDGVWKLFTNLTQELSGNNDVDTSDSSYRTAILNAYLVSGGLTTNSSVVDITANSTVSVSIVANTLTLSSPLAGTSGGTGLSSYTAEDILVANSSNGFRKLGLGADGYVLQSNGSALVYDILDGGTF